MQTFSLRTLALVLAVCSSFVIPHSSLAVRVAHAASVDEIVKKLQARYDTTTGFRADFSQEVESATLGQNIEARGKVFF
jgi:hypothetical protein